MTEWMDIASSRLTVQIFVANSEDSVTHSEDTATHSEDTVIHSEDTATHSVPHWTGYGFHMLHVLYTSRVEDIKV